ncbi:MAG: hypothetical protein CMH54_06200 [Myxococcales bacterium]|nr:hypothetical protein [Myxococcales bacterium]|tara:strand:+ start:1866 stop:2669 length:804 start_codon:yes stop_codon:yes gene_type:complete
MSELTKEFQIRAAGLTDVGLVRVENEDAFFTLESPEIYIVADGMGGHNAGAVASAMAVSAIRDNYLEGWSQIQSTLRIIPEDLVKERLREALLDSIHFANSSIYQSSVANPELDGMGTTVVAVVGAGEHLAFGHVGDSRIYRFRDKKIAPVTRDHSLLNYYLDQGWITQEQIPYFPHKHIILQALGVNPEVEPDVIIRRKHPGDVYLLCSDGLTDLIDDPTLESIAEEMGLDDLARLSEAYVEAALRAGGVDNITALLLAVESTSSE